MPRISGVSRIGLSSQVTYKYSNLKSSTNPYEKNSFLTGAILVADMWLPSKLSAWRVELEN